MLRKNILYLLLLGALTALAASCSNTKYLPEGETLYTGSTVNLQDKEGDRKYRKTIKKDLDGAVRPKPNSTLLGIRLKLTIYNFAGDTSKKGFFRNTIRKFGEPPVLASTLDLAKNDAIFVNLMQNRGYFYPTVKSRTETKNKRTRAIFDVWTGPLYKIRNVEFPIDSSQISIDMATTKEKTLLKLGQPYNLDLIKGERDRIDKELTEKGYYYFRPDYVIALADTTVGDNEVDIYMKAKHEEIPEQAYYVYHIDEVFVYPNYNLRRERADTNMANATLHEGYYVVDRRNTFRPIVFEQAMQFKPGDLYNRTEQNMSLSRLVSLGTFKFVKNRFEPDDNPADPKLDVFYYLTPYPKKSLRFEIGVESQNDSRLGTQSSISWRNRNAFRGAELLAVTLRGGYEAQAGGNTPRPPTFEGGLEMSLAIPRFLIPFIKVVPSNMFIPRTTIKASYDISLRQNLYLITSMKGSYGYVFKEDIRKEHQLFPININYVKTDTLLFGGDQTLNYSNLLFNGLIIGPTYEYTFNGQATGLKTNNYYLNTLVDFSNNILGLVQGASPTNPQELLGTRYAQYMKYQVDGRYYRNYSINKNDIWASRIILGFGYPYGNSRSLPNIKQFFSGGASSLRGFRSRLVGPGRYNQEYLNDGTTRFIETLGDVKLELNTELRKNIYQFVNGAIFLDAGNIWTYYDDPRFPGGKFTSNFYKELAVDAGIGLRFDFQILLLRLDVAYPLRKPWLPAGQEWSVGKSNTGKSFYQETIFNLAIGYPF